LELKPDDLNAVKFPWLVAEIGLNQWDKAVADFSAVIKRNRTICRVMIGARWAYRSSKNYDAAIADYTF